MRHNPRCAIYDMEPGLRRDSDCNCGAIPPLEHRPPVHQPFDFRLVARGGKWEVHTAVPPTEGLELRFTSGLTV